MDQYNSDLNYFEYNYYEFENTQAKDLFISFCKKNNIMWERGFRYCTKTDGPIQYHRTTIGAFEDIVTEIHPELDGIIDTLLTVDFLLYISSGNTRLHT